MIIQVTVSRADEAGFFTPLYLTTFDSIDVVTAFVIDYIELKGDQGFRATKAIASTPKSGTIELTHQALPSMLILWRWI